jgi:hypothetical protein
MIILNLKPTVTFINGFDVLLLGKSIVDHRHISAVMSCRA